MRNAWAVKNDPPPVRLHGRRQAATGRGAILGGGDRAAAAGGGRVCGRVQMNGNGDEMNITAYQDDGDFGKKFIAEQRQWIAEFEANPEDGQHNLDASDFSGLLGEALTEIERLNSQIAARDALIERLRELITRVTNEVNLWDNQPLLDDLMKESVE